ncbi:PREDICTED: sn1-specific diacylglycerol lipase beta-like [Eufriesea mexicana]|uniref:sn1-specific diacylglycerol lipase beta-like n=1 Tax=Eufriesea mexicana TaxID=516756 RepID=UPI00083C42B2|nr:PREDICTED: sn1-specific diacylglycerol lipase beta-like [Eufriesea mexicana]
MFGVHIECSYEHYTITVVQALIVFDWILIGLTIFGLAVIFDPLGSLSEKYLESSEEHGKVLRIWLRRFKFLWWIRKDENAKEAFQHVAGLLTALFRGTDLVPSDLVAGFILLRIQQKREVHELRRLNLPQLACTSNASVIFKNTPSWMSLENALYYIKLSIASYGWLYLMYKHTCTGCFHIIRNMTCCTCFRRKRNPIIGDNCCQCYMAGVKSLMNIAMDDVLYASFVNHLCEVPFCVLVNHNKGNIDIAIRGTLSLRDIFTDVVAGADIFECEGIPAGSQAHKGMIMVARVVLKHLDDNKVLEQAFNTYPHYSLMITGHSLGAGVGILLGFLLRPRYPSVKVYAFATPAGLLSRELVKLTEDFVLTIGVEDDMVMRMSIHSTENLRTSLLVTLHACQLPKYRVVLNGLGYILFGIPEKDLTKTWTTCSLITSTSGESPLLVKQDLNTIEENKLYEEDVTKRRFSRVKLYTGGRILHIRRCKPEKSEKKSKRQKISEKNFEMRWAQAEEFTELSVMPRMLLDHLPENIEKVLIRLIEQQNNLPYYFDP